MLQSSQTLLIPTETSKQMHYASFHMIELNSMLSLLLEFKLKEWDSLEVNYAYTIKPSSPFHFNMFCECALVSPWTHASVPKWVEVCDEHMPVYLRSKWVEVCDGHHHWSYAISRCCQRANQLSHLHGQQRVITLPASPSQGIKNVSHWVHQSYISLALVCQIESQNSWMQFGSFAHAVLTLPATWEAGTAPAAHQKHGHGQHGAANGGRDYGKVAFLQLILHHKITMSVFINYGSDLFFVANAANVSVETTITHKVLSKLMVPTLN